MTIRSLSFLLLGLLGTTLLFIPTPTSPNSPLEGEVWNLGHVLLFFVVSFLALEYRFKTGRSLTINTLCWALFIALASGASIEFLQNRFFERQSSVTDLMLDLLGTYLAFAYHYWKLSPEFKVRKIMFALSSFVLSFLALLPITNVLIDESHANALFPTISDMENPREIRRWSANANIQIVEDTKTADNHLLEVVFTSDKYSWVSIQSPNKDWSQARVFQTEIYNPSKQNREITCRINDKKHRENEQLYNDRFNQRYTLQPGKNTIEIPIEEIRSAPASRTMELSEMDSISFFATEAKEPFALYLDNVTLQ
jgi:VanZ family protein